MRHFEISSDGDTFSVEDLRFMYEHTPNGIVCVDSNGIIQRCNKAFSDLLGLGISSIEKKPIA